MQRLESSRRRQEEKLQEQLEWKSKELSTSKHYILELEKTVRALSSKHEGLREQMGQQARALLEAERLAELRGKTNLELQKALAKAQARAAELEGTLAREREERRDWLEQARGESELRGVMTSGQDAAGAAGPPGQAAPPRAGAGLRPAGQRGPAGPRPAHFIGTLQGGMLVMIGHN
jgi:hypothetical protein